MKIGTIYIKMLFTNKKHSAFKYKPQSEHHGEIPVIIKWIQTNYS